MRPGALLLRRTDEIVPLFTRRSQDPAEDLLHRRSSSGVS